MAVAVVIDRIFQIGRGQELGLADSPAQAPCMSARRHVAAIDDLQRRDQFAAEFVRPAAIVSERRQRPDGRKLSRIGAEVGFQPPDRDDDRARHAVLLFDAAESRAVLRRSCGARQPRRHHPAGKLLEALPEHALGMIACDDGRIVGDGRQRRLDSPLRDAGTGGFLLDALQPGAEIAAAGGALGRSRQGRQARQGHSNHEATPSRWTRSDVRAISARMGILQLGLGFNDHAAAGPHIPGRLPGWARD